MRLLRLAGLTLILTACSYGDIITITQTGVGSGTVAGAPFTAAAFTITEIGNTSSRTSFADGFIVPDTSASIFD